MDDALPWLDALTDPATYPHPVAAVQVVHTHLSVVALTGEYAYKLKKPVDYGFVDFTTLEKRRRACAAEVRLNQRAAAALYLDVVPLVQTTAGWRIGAAGEAVEWAVKMRQFDPELQLDRVAARAGGLAEAVLDPLADNVAALHAKAAAASEAMARSYPARLAGAIDGNFATLPGSPATGALRAAFDRHLAAQGPLLDRRAAAGWVRECHGDLHLANICLWEGRPLPFDCIEFNDDFRTIDTLADLAFLFMDLTERGLIPAAWRVLNRYLEVTGDYAGLPAFPLFVAYRAHVRAKIAHLTASAPGVPDGERAGLKRRRDRYLALAAETLAPHPGALTLTVGLPGSGKSTVALARACTEGGVRIRSDVERKRLHAADPALDLYGDPLGALTYQTLLRHARAVVAAGYTAILDATYLRQAYRAPVATLAAELGVPLRILHCDAPLALLQSRVRARAAAHTDVSDADEAVLLMLASTREDFTAAELPPSWSGWSRWRGPWPTGAAPFRAFAPPTRCARRSAAPPATPPPRLPPRVSASQARDPPSRPGWWSVVRLRHPRGVRSLLFTPT